VDVMSTIMWCLGTEFFREWTTAPDRFMSMIAAAVHDVGHPGKNNAFFSKTWDLGLPEPTANLAVRYNDKSILENFHIAQAFETMQLHEDSNWFRLMSKNADGVNVQSYFRRGLIHMVLQTDMSKHGKNSKLLQEFGDIHAGHAPSEDKEKAMTQAEQSLEDKMFMLGSALHASDISNPTKPRKIMLAWTKRVLDEFWLQGDVEKNLGFTQITMLCDREVESKKIPMGQLGFIGFVVEPYWKSLSHLVPELQQAMDQLAQNKAFWTQRKADEGCATYEKIFFRPTQVNF